MQQILGLEFQDAGTEENAWVGVRIAESSIGLARSLEHDGDVEIFFSIDVCKRLVEALEQACVLADGAT
jgi:hypothetical protein